MTPIHVEILAGPPLAAQGVEIVERKGVGHPDTICDAVAEAVSVALCRAYEEALGRIVHHNIDKGLLVAGRASPRFGGGSVDEPMRLVLGDRALDRVGSARIPVEEIVHETARRWIADHLRFVDPLRDVRIQSEIRPGSAELVDIFERGPIGANDTSAAVGYAPMSETERLCLAAEAFLNGSAFKARHPEAGEDVKVMAVRRGRQVHLQVAIAFVDRFLVDIDAYFEAKAAIEAELAAELAAHLESLEGVSVDVNTLDDRQRGAAGIYLTVTGTSAEAGDSGQVGRGNRVNGVIGVNRPMGTEAAAGKNPLSHPGKVYTLLSHRLAQEIHQRLAPEGVAEVYVWLVSQIGRPLDRPQVVSVQLIPQPGRRLPDLTRPVAAVVDGQLGELEAFLRRLALGELTVW